MVEHPPPSTPTPTATAAAAAWSWVSPTRPWSMLRRRPSCCQGGARRTCRWGRRWRLLAGASR